MSNHGSVGGVRLLSAAGLDPTFELQAAGPDVITGMPVRLGIGYGFNGPEVPVSPNLRACYWGGWGGSIVINDLDARTTIAYAMNRMGDGLDTDMRGIAVVLAFIQSHI